MFGRFSQKINKICGKNIDKCLKNAYTINEKKRDLKGFERGQTKRRGFGGAVQAMCVIPGVSIKRDP